MSKLSMSKQEREAFLAALHVGVLAVEQADGPALLTPSVPVRARRRC
jgi:hypothetical protein